MRPLALTCVCVCEKGGQQRGKTHISGCYGLIAAIVPRRAWTPIPQIRLAIIKAFVFRPSVQSINCVYISAQFFFHWAPVCLIPLIIHFWWHSYRLALNLCLGRECVCVCACVGVELSGCVCCVFALLKAWLMALESYGATILLHWHLFHSNSLTVLCTLHHTRAYGISLTYFNLVMHAPLFWQEEEIVCARLAALPYTHPYHDNLNPFLLHKSGTDNQTIKSELMQARNITIQIKTPTPTSVHRRAPRKHTFTHSFIFRGNLEQPLHLPACFLVGSSLL